MTAQHMVAMARPYWSRGMEATPTIASTVANMYSTDMSVDEIGRHLEWVHASRRDLVEFLLHWIASDSRDGRTADAMLQTLWRFLSHMQR